MVWRRHLEVSSHSGFAICCLKHISDVGLAVGAACSGETAQVKSRNYGSFPSQGEKLTKKKQKKVGFFFSPGSNGTISFHLSFLGKKKESCASHPMGFVVEGQELLQPKGFEGMMKAGMCQPGLLP